MPRILEEYSVGFNCVFIRSISRVKWVDETETIKEDDNMRSYFSCFLEEKIT